MSEKFYYVNAVGEKVGPVTLIALKSLAKANILSPSTAIIPEGGTKMYEAEKISGLFDNVTASHGTTSYSQSVPMMSSQPTSSHPTPPIPVMPLSPLESVVPIPLTLKSEGKKLVKPTYRSNDNWLVWCIMGLCFLFLFGSILVGVTWHIATKQATEIDRYEGKKQIENTNEATKFVSNESNEKSPTERIVAQTEKSIALINSPISCGTGFVVAPGIIATNSHVIASERIESLEITFPSAEKTHRGPFKPQLLYEDTVRDIALLQIDSAAAPILSVAKNYQFRRAQKIISIGNPGRGDGVILENAVSIGILSTQTEVDGLPFYQLSIAINPGNSGGPVLNNEGKVIGIITLKAAKTPSMAYCIPVDDVLHAIELSKNLTVKELNEMNAKHLAVVGFRQGLEKVAYESMFGDPTNVADIVADDANVPFRPNRGDTFVESGQTRNADKTWWNTSSSPELPNQEPSLSQLSETEREYLMGSYRDRRYKEILAKKVWMFNGTAIRGKIVGFQEGIVQIRPEGAADTEPPLERYARRFSPADISDILFYARYHGIPTGTLGRR